MLSSSQVCPLWLSLKPIAAKTLFDLSHLYRQFDNHATRSLGDITKPEADALGLSWPLRVTQVILSAALILDSARYVPKIDKVEYLRKYLKQGDFVAAVLPKVLRDYRHMMRNSVVAVMIQSWEKSHERAYEFWFKVRDGENQAKKTMPAYKLRESLRNVVAGLSKHNARQMASQHEIMAKCITAWNAYRRIRLRN